MQSYQGKEVVTDYGVAIVCEYDQQKEKFKVEYVDQGAIGWITESEFILK
tara:strand:+ start:51 stop:200 length:150 start_codon:yes stop_codon:yes gene_type:complete